MRNNWILKVKYPNEESKEAPMNKPNDAEMQLARDYGKLVAETTKKLHR